MCSSFVNTTYEIFWAEPCISLITCTLFSFIFWYQWSIVVLKYIYIYIYIYYIEAYWGYGMLLPCLMLAVFYLWSLFFIVAGAICTKCLFIIQWSFGTSSASDLYNHLWMLSAYCSPINPKPTFHFLSQHMVCISRMWNIVEFGSFSFSTE